MVERELWWKMIQIILEYLNIAITLSTCYKLGKCVIISYMIEHHLNMRRSINDIRFEYTEDKAKYESAMRIFLYLMIITNIIILFSHVIRLIGGYGYASIGLGFMTTGFCTVLFLKSHILLMLFKGSKLDFLNKINKYGNIFKKSSNK